MKWPRRRASTSNSIWTRDPLGAHLSDAAAANQLLQAAGFSDAGDGTLVGPGGQPARDGAQGLVDVLGGEVAHGAEGLPLVRLHEELPVRPLVDADEYFVGPHEPEEEQRLSRLVREAFASEPKLSFDGVSQTCTPALFIAGADERLYYGGFGGFK